MTDAIHLPARFDYAGDQVSAEFSLTLDNHVADVWSALVDSERLPHWLAPGAIEPRAGGRAYLHFEESGGVIDSVITRWQPERELAYSWSAPGEPLRPLHWTLAPLGPMTELTLRVTVPLGHDAARAAAGWAAHLEMLWAYLMGVPVKFPYAAFKQARLDFAQQLAAA